MAGRKPEKIRPIAFAQVASVEDSVTQRALDVVVGAVQDLQTEGKRATVVADLVIGENRITTNLGRRARGMALTPTVADAMFAWSFAIDNDTEVIVTVIGEAQPACPMEIY